MTKATAPVAAEIIARRPPTTEITTAMVKDANRPMAGSTPAMIENEIASGISASATTRLTRISVRQTFGLFSQSGLRPRSRAAGDRTEVDKSGYLSCSGTPARGGACGKTRRAGTALRGARVQRG